MLRNSYQNSVFLGLIMCATVCSHGWANDGGRVMGYESLSKRDNWDFSIGAGAVFGSVYEGSDKTETSFAPVVEAQYKDGLFFAGSQGVGVTPFSNDNGSLSFALGFDGGRDEKDDRKNLRGMGNIDGSALGVISGEYNLGPVTLGTSIQTSLGGDYGTTGDLSIETGYPVNEKFMLTADLNTVWADEEHMKSYFGVSQKQSTASGKRRFDAGAGFKSYGVSFGANYQISESWGAFASLSADQLIGDAADSPLSVEDTQTGGMIGLSYSF